MESDAELHLIYRFSNFYLVEQLFKRIQQAELDAPETAVCCCMKTVRRLCSVFHLWDWRIWIQSERCLFLVDYPQNQVLQRLLKRYPDISQAGFQFYCGDVEAPAQKIQEMECWLNSFKQSAEKAFQNLLFNQIKPVIPPLTKKIRFMVAGHNIFQDACVRSLKGMGYDTARLQWKAPLYRFIHSTAWTREYQNSRFDTAIFLNTTPALFSSSTYLNDLPISNVAWFVDHPRRFAFHPKDFEGCDVIGVFDKSYIPFVQARSSATVFELRTGYGICSADVSSTEEFSEVDVAFVGELGTKGFLSLERFFQEVEPQTLAAAQEVLHSADITQPILFDTLAEPVCMQYQLFYRGARVEYLENKATSLRRRFYLEALVNLGLKVFGDTDWADPHSAEH